ncbi:MAG: glycerol kinase, partial [Ghiorsea sp.]|nr:glycerol kinase [Ghiorsea sp.]
LDSKFLKDKLLEKVDEQLVLTDLGQKIGGGYKESKQYGRYIVWPETIANAPTIETQADARFTAKSLGNEFKVDATKMNSILSELGWIKKDIKGWKVTEQGLKQGGVQDADHKSGIPFARWSKAIVSNKSLLASIQELKGETVVSPKKKLEFREKFKAEFRSTDGHFVRSKAEMLIDNWLYMAEIIHAYERKLPIEEDVYSDFYIPTGKVYIEYWGYENDSKYLHRKKEKIEIYKKYGFNLIELNDEDVQNLDDKLPRLLLKFGIKSY